VLEGKRREASLTYPDAEYIYYFCATEFGWTIEETDNQPAAMIDWLISIHGIVKQVQHDNQQR
jgi:hypothetical protein